MRKQNYGWFDGSEKAWRSLPLKDQEAIAFHETGCVYACPLWETPVDCSHTHCRIKRGELPPIAQTNSVLRGEKENWLRFIDRDAQAKVFRAVRNHSKRCGNYDPWSNGAWSVMVGAGVAS